MKEFTPYYINVRGRLFDLSTPRVMGILNVTPDSFYEASRMETEEAIGRRVKEIVDEGGTMIDVGAYSTRPGAEPVSTKEEMMRLRRGMKVVREVAPDAVVSVDTFRSDVAKMGVPYVLTHNVKPDHLCPVGKTMQGGNQSVLRFFAEKVQQLRDLGQKDIILDPGYGFGKTLEENYELLAHQEMLNVFELPLLVGVSRKSMIYKLLGCTPNEALNGTTVLNTIALQKGASILRVHDVKEAFEVVKLYQKTLNSKL